MYLFLRFNSLYKPAYTRMASFTSFFLFEILQLKHSFEPFLFHNIIYYTHNQVGVIPRERNY